MYYWSTGIAVLMGNWGIDAYAFFYTLAINIERGTCDDLDTARYERF